MSDVRHEPVHSNTSIDPAELPQLAGSLAFTNGPAARALLEFARVSGFGSLENLDLIGHSDAHAEFIDWIVKHSPQIPQLRDLTSMAGHDWEALNSFLVAHGFSPLFTQFNPNDVGICSIVKKAMLWVVAGTPATVHRNVNGEHKSYAGFKIKSDTAHLQQLFGDDMFVERVVLTTQGNETVYLAMLPEDAEGPKNGAQLLKQVRKMLDARVQRSHGGEGIILPMVNFDQVAEVSWLNGLGIRTPDGATNTLASCRQHVRFYMNEVGARLEAAFAGVATRGMAQQPYTVNRHFVLAVVDGTTPTTVLYLHPDDSWSKPPAGVIG